MRQTQYAHQKKQWPENKLETACGHLVARSIICGACPPCGLFHFAREWTRLSAGESTLAHEWIRPHGQRAGLWPACSVGREPILARACRQQDGQWDNGIKRKRNAPLHTAVYKWKTQDYNQICKKRGFCVAFSAAVKVAWTYSAKFNIYFVASQQLH